MARVDIRYVPALVARCADCGLANRLKLMACVHALAAASGARAQVLWLPGPGCAAPAEALFDIRGLPVRHRADGLDPGLVFVEAAHIDALESCWRAPRAHPSRHLHAFTNLARSGRDVAVVDAPGAADFAAPGVSVAALLAHKAAFYARLPLRAELLATVRGALNAWPPGRGALVGVHLRRFDARHDGADGLDFDALSPTAELLRVLRALPEADRLLVFSNDPDAAIALCAALPAGRAVPARAAPAAGALRAGAARDDVQGVRDALVDFALLAHCDAVVGSYFSSFADEAALAGRVVPRYCPLSAAGLAMARTRPYHAAGYVLDEAAAVLHRGGDAALLARLGAAQAGAGPDAEQSACKAAR